MAKPSPSFSRFQCSAFCRAQAATSPRPLPARPANKLLSASSMAVSIH